MLPKANVRRCGAGCWGGLLNGSGDSTPGERLSGDQLAQIVAGQGEKNEDDLKPPPMAEDPAAEDPAGEDDPGDGTGKPPHKPGH